jgi:hypothetical protein
MQLVAGRPSAATAPERAGERERKKKDTFYIVM